MIQSLRCYVQSSGSLLSTIINKRGFYYSRSQMHSKSCLTFQRLIPGTIVDYFQNVKGKWICTLCMKQREYACVSGKWFHGRKAQPAVDSDTFRRKLSDVWNGIESDWVGKTDCVSGFGSVCVCGV